jgi:Mn-containing catalase
MYLHTQQLINEIVVDELDPAAANALQEGLGGQFGEMRTMMQYLFQSMNFRATRHQSRIRICCRASVPKRSATWN